MGDTNHFSGIVKILENPKQRYIDSSNLITTFRVEVPQKRKNTIVRLVFWGNLGREVNKFYRINDYILIEGYISLRPKKNDYCFNPSFKTSNNISFTNISNPIKFRPNVYKELIG